MAARLVPKIATKGATRYASGAPEILPVGIHQHELAVEDVQRADARGLPRSRRAACAARA